MYTHTHTSVYIFFLNLLRRGAHIMPVYLIIIHKNKNILIWIHSIDKFRTFNVEIAL